MKRILMFTLILSFNLYAQEIHYDYEVKSEKVCFEEMKKMGCINKNEVVNVACLDREKLRLSKLCQEIHGKKRKERR